MVFMLEYQRQQLLRKYCIVNKKEEIHLLQRVEQEDRLRGGQVIGRVVFCPLHGRCPIQHALFFK